MYMGDDPEAPNYDKEHRVVRCQGCYHITQGVARAPWSDDSIGFLPTSHCVSMQSPESYAPTAPLAERELSPQVRSLFTGSRGPLMQKARP
jgi:hypothetical protein